MSASGVYEFILLTHHNYGLVMHTCAYAIRVAPGRGHVVLGVPRLCVLQQVKPLVYSIVSWCQMRKVSKITLFR